MRLALGTHDKAIRSRQPPPAIVYMGIVAGRRKGYGECKAEGRYCWDGGARRVQVMTMP